MSADEPTINTEQEENPCIVRLADRWVIMNPGAGLTPDGPGVEHVPYVSSVSIRWNIRHPDGYLIEAGRATALVEGGLAEQDPAGREAGRADGR